MHDISSVPPANAPTVAATPAPCFRNLMPSATRFILSIAFSAAALALDSASTSIWRPGGMVVSCWWAGEVAARRVATESVRL